MINVQKVHGDAINKIDLVYSVLGDEVIKQISSQQANFITQPLDRDSFLKACPGSGKTHSIGIKLAYEINNWISKTSGLAVLSFTKNAANEIKSRTQYFLKESQIEYPHFVGTVDSWLHAYIFHPFAKVVTGFLGTNNDYTHRLIQDGNHGQWLKNYSYKEYSVLGYSFNVNDQIVFTSPKKISSLKEYELNILRENKEKFAKAGFVTYADIEYWTYKLLQKRGDILDIIAARFPYIFIDECQDLSEIQLEIFDLLKQAGVSIHLVGDLNQAIYEFREVYPEKVHQMTVKWGLERLELTMNHRSVQQICNVVGSLNGSVQIQANRSSLVKPCILWIYDKNKSMDQIQKAFLNLLNQRGIDSENAVVMARGNSLIEKLKGQLISREQEIAQKTLTYKIASAVAYWNAESINEKNRAIQLFSQAIINLAYNSKAKKSNTLTPSPYDPMEWRLLLAAVLDKLIVKSEFIIKDFPEQTWKQWIKLVLKQELKEFWENLRETDCTYDEISRRIKAPPKISDEVITKDFLMEQIKIKSELSFKTIHSVKGETYKAALLVSSPTKNSEGGHFTHWLHRNTEANRLAYVACSRPKELLVIAIPEHNEEFLQLGFLKEDMPV